MHPRTIRMWIALTLTFALAFVAALGGTVGAFFAAARQDDVRSWAFLCVLCGLCAMFCGVIAVSET